MPKEKLMKYCHIDYKKRICLAMNFISQNLGRDLSLDEIAERVSFSKYHFHRIFKAVVGETIAGFTRRLRLELAANHLIAKPSADITNIAMDCGFSSSQNFAKAFHQHFGMTPTKYRKSKIGNMNSKNENVRSLQAMYDCDAVRVRTFTAEETRAIDVEVSEMPDLQVAYVRTIGPLTPEICGRAFEKLMHWAGPRNLVGPGTTLAIYWDNPDVTPADKCRFDACNMVPEGTVPEGDIHLQTISGGPYAVCHFECTPTRIQLAWEDAFSWLCGSGYECRDQPCFERYHNDAAQHPDGKWIFDICIPLTGEG
jgi:AraC family transcriptional regulator